MVFTYSCGMPGRGGGSLGAVSAIPCPPLDGERYLTDKEVAELLRVSRRTLQEYRNNRILPFILLAGKVLYPESGLREVLEANYRKPLKG